MRAPIIVLLVQTSAAVADPSTAADPFPPEELGTNQPEPSLCGGAWMGRGDEPAAGQLQLALGAGTFALGYERRITRDAALQLEAHVITTEPIALAGAGDKLEGFGAGVRPVWFGGNDERGTYVSLFARVDRVHGYRAAMAGSGVGYAAGIVGGWRLEIEKDVEIRLGIGIQIVRYHVDTAAGPLAVNTPFLAFDAAIGYRH